MREQITRIYTRQKNTASSTCEDLHCWKFSNFRANKRLRVLVCGGCARVEAFFSWLVFFKNDAGRAGAETERHTDVYVLNSPLVSIRHFFEETTHANTLSETTGSRSSIVTQCSRLEKGYIPILAYSVDNMCEK